VQAALDDKMRLYEFESSPLDVRLVATTAQLKSDIDSKKKKGDWTTEELLQFYKDNDIIVDKSDLYDMIKKPPLNKYISNIQGDKVVFKGQVDATATPDEKDKNQEIVKSMANKAMKN